jgi:AmmeMemoRadiSam system protein B
MAALKEWRARRPAVAGMFYPADADECRRLARQYVFGNEATSSVEATTKSPDSSRESSSGALGGVVPHAGWICSGAIAGEAIREIARGAGAVDVVVVFGAVHTPIEIDFAALDSHTSWLEPGSETQIAQEIRTKLSAAGGMFAIDDQFHQREHAVEVELPLIREAWPSATLLPIEVPLIDDSIEIGKQVARQINDAKLRAVYLASSDLTHYGPAYRFAPAGVGLQGLDWAKRNDQRVLDRIEAFEIDQVVPEVRHHQNACGGGAIAAMMSACREQGASGARVIRHASSYETLKDVAPQRPDNAVGYAGVIVR